MRLHSHYPHLAESLCIHDMPLSCLQLGLFASHTWPAFLKNLHCSMRIETQFLGLEVSVSMLGVLFLSSSAPISLSLDSLSGLERCLSRAPGHKGHTMTLFKSKC